MPLGVEKPHDGRSVGPRNAIWSKPFCLFCGVKIATYCLKPLVVWGLFLFQLMLSWLLQAFDHLSNLIFHYFHLSPHPETKLAVPHTHLCAPTFPAWVPLSSPVWIHMSSCPWLRMQGKCPRSTQLPLATAGGTPSLGPQILYLFLSFSAHLSSLCISVSGLCISFPC